MGGSKLTKFNLATCINREEVHEWDSALAELLEVCPHIVPAGLTWQKGAGDVYAAAVANLYPLTRALHFNTCCLTEVGIEALSSSSELEELAIDSPVVGITDAFMV